MNLYIYRLLGAVTLDASMYEGIEHDTSTTGQAALTVVLASLATGLAFSGQAFSIKVILAGAAIAVVLWIAWAVLTLQIGLLVMPVEDTRVTLGELLRTTGFAAAPGFIQIFAVIPSVARPVQAIAALWTLAAVVIAVRHALDYRHTSRAVIVCLMALSLCVVLAIGLGLLLTRSAS